MISLFYGAGNTQGRESRAYKRGRPTVKMEVTLYTWY